MAACSPVDKKSAEEKSPYGDKKIIAYVTSWEENWGPSFEKANQITHINYAFANVIDGQVVEGAESDTETIKKLNELKKVNKNLKILISIGGWTWSGNFSDAALTEESRERFANSAIAFMQKHKIDGIDIDWEYPGLPGAGNVHRPEDKENFTLLLKLIREKLDVLDSNNSYLLTIASGASQSYLDHTNMQEAHQYLDFINIMTYDFYVGGTQSGHHANLYASSFSDQKRSGEVAIRQHQDAGIPIEKIVLGVPFYGRWWKGVNPENDGLYQPTEGAAGSINYNVLADSLEGNSGFITLWDSTAQTSYIWRASDSLFLTYDNPQSIRLKADFVKSNNMGGIMFWQFNGDNGDLLNAISDSF